MVRLKVKKAASPDFNVSMHTYLLSEIKTEGNDFEFRF